MKNLALALTVFCCLLAAAVLSPTARGAATCEPATVVAFSEADAWVDANSVTANKGSDAVLSVGDTTRALVRFRLPADVPDGCVVGSAKLRLFADSGTEGARVEALALASPWSEGSVTWITQPAPSGTAAAAWSRDGYMQWNVTGLMPAMLGGSNHGFVLRDAAESTDAAGGHGFYAREKGENPPQLVIRFAPPPSGDPGPPAPPEPAAVKCGQLLTRSTLVTNDLSNCQGDGVLIGAPRIIVDLDGHTLDGVGLGTGVRNEGYESVTVRNGTVTDFDRGVELLEETRSNLVERLRLHHNEVAAIELFDAGGLLHGNDIRGNTLEYNGGGILLVSGTRGTVVANNSMTLNSGPGILLDDADANRLEANRISGGGDLGVALEHSSGNVLVDNDVSDTSDGGIEIVAGSHDNRVEGSDVRRAGDTGILVGDSDGSRLIANTTLGMSDSGITLNGADHGVVRDNQLSGNPGGIQIDGSSGNLIEANDASLGSGIGIELGGGSYGNTLALNTTNRNGAQGIYVADEALLELGNLLLRNTANENGSDGITVAKGGHALTANVAHGNRGWGLNAVGINAVSRNRAAANGQAGQCLGLGCLPLDVTAPETTIDSGPAAFASTTTATFAFSANEEFVTFECALDGAKFTPCGSPAEYADLADGSHELLVRASDESGNVDATPARHAWAIHKTPPDTAIDSGPDPVTSSGMAVFTFSAVGGATFECALDGADFTPCSSPVEYTSLAEGSHTFQVRATDAAGNSDATPESHVWTIDRTPPETVIESGPGAVTSKTTATFAFAADEADATLECSLDRGAFSACSSPAEYTDLAEGSHTFEVRATDRLGNADESPAGHEWTIDRTPPETAIESGSDALTSSTTAVFNFSADERSTFECALDDAPFATCASPAEYTDLAPGSHTLQVRATDAAGNTDATPATHAWTIDMPPQTRVESGPDAVTSGAIAVFTFSAGEPSTFECSLDDAAFTACASPAEYTELAAGDHSFRVRATDPAGNVDPTPATHAWTIDRTPPETMIDSGPDALTNRAGATFVFSAGEPAMFECSLDGAVFAPCSSPAEHVDLTGGDHDLRVRATDAAGNVDDTPARYGWTIDRTPPQAGIDTATTEGAEATFAFSAGEPATFECSLDGAAFGACSSPAEYRDLSAGDHSFAVVAIDAAGNVGGTPATHAWTIQPPADTTAPQTAIDTAPEPGTGSTDARFTFSASEPATFECSLDGAAFSRCDAPQDYAGLAIGEHTFQVRATDAAGNVDDAPASHDWTIQPPAVRCTASTVTASANADSWVLESSATTNYRDDSALKVDSKGRANARVLVRFSLPTIATGCRVVSATLGLYASSYKENRTLAAFRLGAPWTESGITWNNQPATAGGAATTASGSGYREWQVTSHVAGMYEDGNHGFLVRDSVEGGGGVEQAFNSREKGSDNPPRLVIAFG